jgi:hypothetical protein
MESQVHLLADRVAHLEHVVFGSRAQQQEDEKHKPKPQAGDVIAAVHGRVTELAKNDMVKSYWTAFAEISALLNGPSFQDAVIPTKTKEEMIISAEASLKAIAEQLRELDSYSEFLNTGAQQELPNVATKILPLEQVNLASRDDLEALSKRTAAVLGSYNEIVALLSRKFLLWDQALSALERRVSATAFAADA